MVMHANSASVTPSVVSWALHRADKTVVDIANGLGVNPDSVQGWVDGTSKPSFTQARSLASRLRIPFGFLFLSQPPPDDLPIPDFRTLDGHAIGPISLDLRDVLLAVMRKQSWLSEERQESGAEPIEIVGKFRQSNSSDRISDDIRQRLNLTSSYRPASGADAFLRDLVARVETVGVNVLRSGVVGNNTSRKLKVEEFRGFALSDQYAPFIFINSVDARQAQAFTLIHELAHIFRGDTGISGGISQGSLAVETLCNRVAADVLVPPTDFVREWSTDLPPRDAIQLSSRYFHMSRYVIAIRAFESGLISRTLLDTLLDEYRSDSFRASSSSGGDFYRTLISRNGHALTEGVVSAVNSQSVLVRDAAGILDAKPGQLSRIARELHGSD